MNRIILPALAALLVFAAAAQAQQPNFYIEKPPTWIEDRSNLGDELEAQFFAPNDDGLIEIYAAAIEPLDLEPFADEWVKFVVSQGLPLHNLVTNAESHTNTGVPGLVREYTGKADGADYHALLIFSHYNGFMYVAMGLYTEESAAVNHPVVYAALDSFGFPDSLQQGQPYNTPGNPITTMPPPQPPAPSGRYSN